MTERGIPSQMKAQLKSPPQMNNSQNSSKFKSAFGIDGSQLNPKKGITAGSLNQSKMSASRSQMQSKSARTGKEKQLFTNEESSVDQNQSPSQYDQQQMYTDEEEQRSPDQHQLTSDDEHREGEAMLFVDVNLGNSGTQRIVIYEGDTAEKLAKKFARKHNLDANMEQKLIQMLE